jgi:hypothetical protein
MCSLERQGRTDDNHSGDGTSRGSVRVVLQGIQENIGMRSLANTAGSSVTYRDERSCVNCTSRARCWDRSDPFDYPIGFQVRPEKTTEQLTAYWGRTFSAMCNNFTHTDPNVHRTWLFNQTKDLNLLKDPQWEE